MDDLEKEVLCLRELLSHLLLEEQALLKGQLCPTSSDIRKQLTTTCALFNRKRKDLPNDPETVTFLEQIATLKEKIAAQRKVNLSLKKQRPTLTPEKRKPKKKPLLLEDEETL